MVEFAGSHPLVGFNHIGLFLPAGAGQRMASSLLLNLNLNPTNANKHFKAQDAKSVQSKYV